ncbi:LysR family transcriptional regulator [Gordonia sinesedis]
MSIQWDCSVACMIDPHRLRVFRAVVAEGSIGGAADALGYTSSAVSQHIAALQRETGLVLIEREGRGIVPTQAGTTLASEAAAVFDHLSRVDGLVADLRDGRAGSLRVTYFASAGSTWMPSVVATIRHEFPDVRLELRLCELSDGSGAPPDVEIVVEGSTPPAIRGYDRLPLVTEDYLAVVAPDSPFAGRSGVTLRELAEETWVDNDVARGPCREALLNACTAAGFTPCFGVETHDYPTALRFVAAGVGLTVVPALALVDLPTGVSVVPISDPPQRVIAIHRRHSVRDSGVADRLIELVREQASMTHGDTAIGATA